MSTFDLPLAIIESETASRLEVIQYETHGYFGHQNDVNMFSHSTVHELDACEEIGLYDSVVGVCHTKALERIPPRQWRRGKQRGS